MEDDLNLMLMEDDLNFKAIGRHPQFLQPKLLLSLAQLSPSLSSLFVSQICHCLQESPSAGPQTVLISYTIWFVRQLVGQWVVFQFLFLYLFVIWNCCMVVENHFKAKSPFRFQFSYFVFVFSDPAIKTDFSISSAILYLVQS